VHTVIFPAWRFDAMLDMKKIEIAAPRSAAASLPAIIRRIGTKQVRKTGCYLPRESPQEKRSLS
jgi:hypothetical protein